MTQSPEQYYHGPVLSSDYIETECIRHWFEMNPTAVEAGLALQRAAGRGAAAMALRMKVLAAAMERPGSLASVSALYHDCMDCGRVELAAVAAAAAVDAVLEAGSGLERLDTWRLKLDALLQSDGLLSPRACAALLLRRGVIALIRDADTVAAASAFEEGGRIAEDASSVPLHLAHQALGGIVDCLRGNQIRADVRLSDMEYLCRQACVGAVPRAMVLSTLGLVKLLGGDAARAYALLVVAWGERGDAGLGRMLPLLILGHRIYAAADLCLTDEVAELARLMGARVIPAHQAVMHAYRHLALGVVALRGGEALRALVNAEECVQEGRRSGSALLPMLAAILEIQALADLRRLDGVRALLAQWEPRWMRQGLVRLVAMGRMELAMVEARYGELDRAHEAYSKAREVLQAGEPLVSLHRGRAWLAELETLLTSGAPGLGAKAPVRIRTLGDFVVEIKGVPIYDRDWKGVRTKSLLIALICEGGQKVPAERLADLLWPDSDGAQAMQNLKVALHRLRRLGSRGEAAPLNWVHVKHGLVSLPKSLCQVDAHEFLAEASRAGPNEPGRALELYRGDFLPASGNQPYVEAYRCHLKGVFGKLQKRAPQPLKTPAVL